MNFENPRPDQLLALAQKLTRQISYLTRFVWRMALLGFRQDYPLYTWAARARDAAASLAEKAAGCRRGGDDCNGRTAGGRMCA